MKFRNKQKLDKTTHKVTFNKQTQERIYRNYGNELDEDH